VILWGSVSDRQDEHLVARGAARRPGTDEAGAGKLGARVPKEEAVIPGEESPRHPIVELAKRAVETYVQEDRIVEPIPLPPELPARAGVFVTIRRRGALRGCIGTIEPVASSLAEEVIRSALLAATEDPRFTPVRLAELSQLTYSVSVLEPAELVEGIGDLDPSRYGVIVQSGHRRGLLLPGIEGIDDPEVQVDVASRKAGIPNGAPVQLFRFRTQHFE